MSKPQRVVSPAPSYVPPVPLTVENTQLDFGFLADLALKTVYSDANCTTERAAEARSGARQPTGVRRRASRCLHTSQTEPAAIRYP